MNVNSNADDVVPATGGRIFPPLGDYPSASETLQRWKTASGCRADRRTTSRLLLTNNAEAHIEENFNCTRGNKVIGVTLLGQNHAPRFVSNWFAELLTIANVHR